MLMTGIRFSVVIMYLQKIKTRHHRVKPMNFSLRLGFKLKICTNLKTTISQYKYTVSELTLFIITVIADS